jgi:UPF0755 protein
MRTLALVGILVVGIAAYLLQRDWTTPYGSFPKEGLIVDIPKGTSRTHIAELLEAKGVIRSARSFRLLSLWHRGRHLQAGEYFFDRPVTPQEVHGTMVDGWVYLHTVTVPEGYTMFDIAELLEREGLAARSDFLKAAGEPSLVRDVAPDARNDEGFLFPDTYKFARGMTPRRITEAMSRRFHEEWKILLFPKREAQPTPMEIITVASLVERETAVPEERPRVASVFYNRLRKGMALDCDPTVIYALRLDGRPPAKLSSADLRVDSAYNTYKHRGLPPGPIGNPGKASLRAALEPESTDYLYFVADAEGHHIFSRTLAEHNRNVARYRKKLAAIAREARAASAPGRQSP